MISILEYPFVTPYTYALSFLDDSFLVQWLVNGRLAEKVVVQPTNNVQVVRPSAQNRYLESVTISNQFPRVYKVTVVVGSSMAANVPGATVATTDTATTATASVASEVVTVTGVAEGTTVVRVYNGNDVLVGLIVVTVTA
jgi:hypothetical protein